METPPVFVATIVPDGSQLQLFVSQSDAALALVRRRRHSFRQVRTDFVQHHSATVAAGT